MPTSRKVLTRTARRRGIRAKIIGTPTRPRLAIFKSLTAIYAQLIDDEKGITIAAASDIGAKKGTKTERAAVVGKTIAAAAKAAKIETVVFDRGGYRFHGRVKALAEASRTAGLKF